MISHNHRQLNLQQTHPVSVGGVVASRTRDFERFGPAGVFGYRWTDVTDVPDAPLVAWVEFIAPM